MEYNNERDNSMVDFEKRTILDLTDIYFIQLNLKTGKNENVYFINTNSLRWMQKFSYTFVVYKNYEEVFHTLIKLNNDFLVYEAELIVIKETLNYVLNIACNDKMHNNIKF